MTQTWCFRWTMVAMLVASLTTTGLAQAPADPAKDAPTAEQQAAGKKDEEKKTDDKTAEEPKPPEMSTEQKIIVAVDTMWVLITGMLVFFMNLGFGCVESGFCRAKNCVNIVSKNFIVFAVSTLGFWIIGFGLMFGNGVGTEGFDWIGKEGLFLVSGADNSPMTLTEYKGDYAAIAWTNVPLWAKFFFQLVFCGTAATIVSGAVAERIKYHSFIIFSLFLTAVIYPIVGHWVWGGGWLQASKGFVDFAGSTQVHSIGGWAALAGIIVLGPRKGKYGPDGKVNAIPGHNMTAAFIGCLVLWFGWFGFNPGSTMAVVADAGAAAAEVAVTTNTAAAVATITATATAWILLGKPDIGMTLNGCLAGLVAITAPCAFVTAGDAAIIGGIAGVMVVLGVLAFDRIKIDDPVGATSVHLLNGVFGTLCVGLFSEPSRIGRSANPLHKAGLFYGGGMDQTITQLIGIGSVAVFTFVLSLAFWMLLKMVMGIRVSEQEEVEGLDFGEHGNEAYHGFVMVSTDK